jgi:hypothetical protein
MLKTRPNQLLGFIPLAFALPVSNNCCETKTLSRGDLQVCNVFIWRHDTQHNDIQQNDTQHKVLICDTQHK